MKKTMKIDNTLKTYRVQTRSTILLEAPLYVDDFRKYIALKNNDEQTQKKKMYNLTYW